MWMTQWSSLVGNAMSSALQAHQAPLLAVPAALLLGLPLVVQLLAARERDLELGPALLVEIQSERHDRHALALDPAGELVDLPAVEQQLARPLGRMIEAAGLQIFRDIGVDEPH